jgi:phosphoribosylanthranilate isomerase
MERQGKSTFPALKICGLTTAADTAQCLALGVDFAGFNLCPASKRFIAPDAARRVWLDALAAVRRESASPVRTRPVAVVVDATEDGLARALAAFPELTAVQFHGSETADAIRQLRGVLGARDAWKAVPVRSREDVAAAAAFAGVCALALFDTAKAAPGASVLGGSGQSFDWRWLDAHARGAGRLPLGVAGGIKAGMLAALAAHAPDLVDVCSGVEATPGRKDPAKVDALWRELRGVAW